MNLRGKAFLLVFGMTAALGCGARTDTLFDEGAGDVTGSGGSVGRAGSASGGNDIGIAGTLPIEIGGRSQGGTGNNAAGSPPIAGAFPTAGTFGFGGNSSVGGGFPAGGAFPTGGAFPEGGTFPTAGAFPTAGSPSGGFGAVGAEAGTGGIVDLCVNTAPNDCGRCLCKTCGTQVESCFNDLGCALIFACVESSGCSGFNCLQSCGQTIAQFGGLTGPSAQEAFSLGTCALGSGQSCGCN